VQHQPVRYSLLLLCTFIYKGETMGKLFEVGGGWGCSGRSGRTIWGRHMVVNRGTPPAVVARILDRNRLILLKVMFLYLVW
jgi:hypothetical protein